MSPDLWVLATEYATTCDEFSKNGIAEGFAIQDRLDQIRCRMSNIVGRAKAHEMIEQAKETHRLFMGR